MSSSSDSDYEDSDSGDKNNYVDFQARFERLFVDCKTSDCDFVVGPQKTVIKGHKVLFAMASQVFHAMFYSELKEAESIRIEDLEPVGFQGIKQFIYTDEVTFTSALQASFIYVAARKYLIPYIRKKCVRFVRHKLIASEALEVFEYSKYNDIPEIISICSEFIEEKTGDVMESDYFLSIDIQTVDAILKFEYLTLNSELDVFNHIERWATAEASRRKTSVDKIVSDFNCIKKHIRYLAMSTEEFASGPAKSMLLSQEEKFAIGLNIVNFGTAAYPENFTVVKQQRMPTPFASETHKVLHTFIYDLKKMGTVNHKFQFLDVNWNIRMYDFEDIICFDVFPTTRPGDFLMIFKSKLKILSRMDSLNDFHLENKCYCIFDETLNESINYGIVFCVIPKDDLRRGFVKNDKVVIEGTFILEKAVSRGEDE